MALGLVFFTPGNASAQDGFNTDDGDTVTIGSDPLTGGPTQEAADTMESIQQQMEDLKDRHSGESEGASESDESSGE
jgi:hypothetical protein